jgi:RHS repeat-associated protein
VDTSGGLSQVVADTDGSGNLTALYVRNGGELLAVMRPATGGTWATRFVHSDGLGSVRVLTDETGTTIDSRGYEAFGTKNVEAGSDPLTYGFAGEPFESTSKLAYHRARWMDARVGRFEGMDPKDHPAMNGGVANAYNYVGDSPLSYIDPSGQDFDMVSLGAAVAGFGILSTIGVADTPLSHDGDRNVITGQPPSCNCKTYGPFMHYRASGVWLGSTSFSIEAGQGVHFVVQNLGYPWIQFRMTTPFDTHPAESLMVLGGVFDFGFSYFASEPFTWPFDVSVSNAMPSQLPIDSSRSDPQANGQPAGVPTNSRGWSGSPVGWSMCSTWVPR